LQGAIEILLKRRSASKTGRAHRNRPGPQRLADRHRGQPCPAPQADRAGGLRHRTRPGYPPAPGHAADCRAVADRSPQHQCPFWPRPADQLPPAPRPAGAFWL